MTTITTVEGDELDLLLAEHYGAALSSVALASVLDANLGLAQLGFRPPAGTRIVLPDLEPDRRRITLWS